jgi:hypothetical protein
MQYFKKRKKIFKTTLEKLKMLPSALFSNPNIIDIIIVAFTIMKF